MCDHFVLVMGVEKFVEYIRHVRLVFPASPLDIVIGNSGGDYDSFISTLMFSYFQHLRNGRVFYPIISFPADNLKLRRDIVHGMSIIGLGEKDLIYVDELKGHGVNEVQLVDHNVIDSPLVNGKVVGIIDHHNDGNQYKSADPRIIEVCGSCSSLVLREFAPEVVKAGLDDKEKKFMSAAILLDTGGLERRVESVDIQSWKGISYNQEVGTLSREFIDAKANIEGLSVYDLLRKDYKEWTTGKIKLGISSTIVPLEEIEKDKEAIGNWIRNRELDILLVMGAFEKDGKFTRELSIHSPSVHVGKIAMLLKEELHLEGNGPIYEQKRVEWSRKKVAPFAIDVFSTLTK